MLVHPKEDKVLPEAMEVIKNYNSDNKELAEVNSMCQDVYLGNDVMSEYNNLDDVRKQVVCLFVCEGVAKRLDTLDDSNREQNLSEVSNVGNFLLQVEPLCALQGIKSKIGIERVLNHSLDNHEVWEKLLMKINKYYTQFE